jgi:hypothetical protein
VCVCVRACVRACVRVCVCVCGVGVGGCECGSGNKPRESGRNPSTLVWEIIGREMKMSAIAAPDLL